ncbi:MAG: hypothetical protein DRO67_00270 [Candidatus Asgardarchaeum californiense]|nr:MAG: hypothetical protein DRO67_00270 [Candidatus Asgardarchaeum californiense]
MTEYLYRYEEIRYSLGVNYFDNPYPGYRLAVHCNKYKIIKRTPKGAWIRYCTGFPEFDKYENKKFVLLTARKKFACETKEEARKSFIARKKRQIEILKAYLEQAETSLYIAETDIENKSIVIS